MEDSIGRPVVNGFYDENGLVRSLNGRLTGVQKVLCSAAEIARLAHDGGYMIPIYSKIGQEVRKHFEKLLNLVWKE